MAALEQPLRSLDTLRSVLLSVAAVIVTGATWALGWLPPMERATGDLLLRASTSNDTGIVPVVAILIDDRSVDRYGPTPWPRDRLAELIGPVAAAGASAVVIDLILADPTTVESDRALATALEGIPRVLAAAFDSDGSWLLPIAETGGAAVAAHAYGEVGPDGVVRTIAATKQGRGLSLPALSLAAARILRPELPIEAGAVLRPEFRPSPQSIASLSATDVLDGSFDPEDVTGRLVFLGIAATGAGDQFVVPTGPRHAPVAGVLAHASAAVSIVRGRLLRVPGRGWFLVAAFILSLGVQLNRDRHGAFDVAAFAGLTVGLILTAAVAVRIGLLLLPVTSLLSAAVASVLLREAFESRVAQRESGRLLQAVLEHVGAQPASVPRTAGGRLGALRHLQKRVLEEDVTRKALLDGMGEGVVLWDRNGEVILANPAAEQLWGGLPKLSDIMQSRETGDPAVVTRGSYHLAVGVTGLASGHLAIIRDISAERTLEKRRQEMQRLVSHELKTPLASIAGFGESLERYELSSDEQRRVAALIRGEARRLQEMVTVFLDLERLGGGDWEGADEVVDLAQVVESRLEILEAAAHARALHVEASIETGSLLRGVPALLERVVDNLIGNAIKYSEDGGKVEIQVRREGDRVILLVRDHGPGIPEEHRGRIFNRFYRVPGSPGTGTGLGLALAKEVVDWHGGCINVGGDEGAGSTFTVSLPSSEEV